MIGDWVVNTEFGKNKIDKIETLEPRRVWLEHGKTYVPIEYIEPIPLTTEILEKNGFVNEPDADGLHYWFTLIDKHTKFSVFYARSVFQWLGPLDFKYVHELQNALRICEIKKEIEL